MTAKPDKIVRDDNLRLVLAKQEGDYIRTSVQKMRRAAILFAVIAILAAGVVSADIYLYSRHISLFDDYKFLPVSLFLIGLVITPYAIIKLIGCLFALKRYKDMQREHDGFLAGYGRKHSD